MTITLKMLNIADLLSGKNTRVLYGDFNVINYLYRQNELLKKDLDIYPDSTLIYIVLKYLYRYSIKKVVSTDFLYQLLTQCSLSKMKIYLFGDTDKVLNEASFIINTNYEGITIQGLQNGYSYINEEVLELINLSKADVLFVGLGLGKQEKWIADNMSQLNVPLIMSVGGWFQYLSGNKKRAPLFMRHLNLEWLFKLINEFRRVWKRYLITFPVFAFRIITGKIKLIIH